MTSSLYEEARALRQRWKQADASLSVCLMVDPAALYGLAVEVPALQGCYGISLVDDEWIQQPEVRPFLLDLDAPGSDAAMQWWCAQGATLHGLSLLAARLSTVALAKALRERSSVHLEPRMPIALRLYDTRILPVAFDVLTAPQRAAMFEGVRHWAYTGRDGELALLSLPLDEQTAASRLPIELNAAQEDALIQASHADQVMPLLGADTWDLLASRRSATQVHALVRELIGRARGHGLEGLAPWAAFCAAWLRFGEHFDEVPPWSERFTSLERGEMSWPEVLRSA